MTGVELIQQERDRQIYQEGFDSKHDYEHINNELARAAICYADPYQNFNFKDLTKRIPNEEFWPEEWDKKWFKPTTRVRDLTKAGALIAAEIDRLLRIEINENKKTLIPEIKRLVDNAFGEFGEEGDNILILSACYYPERNTVEVDEPLERINFLEEDYNKLYFPIGRNWDISTWRHKGKDDLKLNILCENYTIPICDALENCQIEWFAKDYYKDNNDALNEFWYGCIGIMRDYKVVSFVIRDDGLLCSEDSIDSSYNEIIMQL